MKIFIFLIFVCFLLNCDNQTLEYSCNSKLKDKPLSQIRNCLQGKWKYVYATGGLTGNAKFYYNDCCFIEFKSSDSLIITNTSTVRRSKIEWLEITDQFNERTFQMKYPYNQGYYTRGVWGIQNDTLTLYDIANDGYGYILARSN